MKFLSILLFLFLFSSCNYFGLKKETAPKDMPIASTFDEELYKDALENLIPTNISKEDSLVLVKSIINNWAVKQLMLKKSLENNSSQENTAVNELVENYKHSLLINNYKEQLIKQQLDTVISEAEIDTYYTLNKQNFKLNEELLKIKFLNFNNNLINKKEVVALFKSDDLEDSEALENYHLNFKSFQLNDSVWTPLDNIMLKIPFSKEKLLKKTKFIQKQDSLSLYLVAVKDVLKRNELAPKSYIKSTIKQLILHQRKIELIREIEQIIVKDAIQNENFKIY
jgi:adenylate cyclase class IV